MNFSFFFTIILVVARSIKKIYVYCLRILIVSIYILYTKFRSHQENKEINSSCSSSPPTSSSRNWTHDVFLSFRGEDVRRDFLSHIQKEFRGKGITSFIDNEINRGESIGPELIRAIRGSKIAMILISKNYASSKWCLDELVEIMKCREEVGQTVMAIFYKVDPSHVKKLAGDFGKVFDKTCKGQSKEDIERWTRALVKVATIAGYDSNNWDNEATMIEKIATDVSNKLINSVPSSDFDGLVGMNAHMESINLFLSLDSDEVKMIGIWGPSGIGKSTIARVLFHRHSHQFQLSVFMENIKRRYQKIDGYDEYSVQLQLQEEFLSQILNQKDIKIPHLGVARDRLKDKRVFVVLDDVDHCMQLDAVAKETWWFGPGSRIIITTQDKNVLTRHGIKHIYMVDYPREDEAVEIFCTYAFDQKYPNDGFEKLVREITQVPLAGKLPLGLKIMGSYLKRMPIEEWEKEVPKLLKREMESIFEICYNALRPEDKELFLYIACIFKNEHFEKVEAYLANNISDVSQGLHILTEKSFISVSDSGNIEMHDLLAHFGRNIDRKQSRQFLVDSSDIRKVLNNNTTSRGSVIGVVINFLEIKDELNKCDFVMENMSCLQFLRLSHNVPQQYSSKNWEYVWMTSLNSIFNLYRNSTQILKVRLLDWEYFPMTFLPSNFSPEFLVELKMLNSKLGKLWSGNKTITNLKWMNLSYSMYLEELPDLSTAINLCELYLIGCPNLVKLPSSIGNAINLQLLDLSYCWNLVELPSSIESAINLKKLNLRTCLSLVELPSSIGNAINLIKLNLIHCSSLRKLPSSIRNATNLRQLDLSHCSSIVELPQLPESCEMLKAKECESLERLHCSFNNTRFVELNFANCFKLSQEARDVIMIKTSSCKNVILPGEKVPTHFTNRATGSSLSMKLKGFNTDFPRSLRLKACVLLVNKSDVELPDFWYVGLTYHIIEKQNGVKVKGSSRNLDLSWKSFFHPLKEHLHIFDVEEMVSSGDLVFQFEARDERLEIRECGILYPAS